jgi:hypothetical protein
LRRVKQLEVDGIYIYLFHILTWYEIKFNLMRFMKFYSKL